MSYGKAVSSPWWNELEKENGTGLVTGCEEMMIA